MLRREWMCPAPLLPLNAIAAQSQVLGTASTKQPTGKQMPRRCATPAETDLLVHLKIPRMTHTSTEVWEALLSKRCWKGGCCTTKGDENKKVISEKPHYKTENIWESQTVHHTIFVCVWLELLEWHFKTLPATFYFPLSPLFLESSFKSSMLFFSLKVVIILHWVSSETLTGFCKVLKEVCQCSLLLHENVLGFWPLLLLLCRGLHL